MTVHQCANVYNNPCRVHKRAVRRITKYLTRTSTYVYVLDTHQQSNTQIVVYRPHIEKVIKFYVDANFSSGWDQAYEENAENVMSYTGYVITYAGCPVLWCSKLQT